MPRRGSSAPTGGNGCRAGGESCLCRIVPDVSGPSASSSTRAARRRRRRRERAVRHPPTRARTQNRRAGVSSANAAPPGRRHSRRRRRRDAAGARSSPSRHGTPRRSRGARGGRARSDVTTATSGLDDMKARCELVSSRTTTSPGTSRPRVDEEIVGSPEVAETRHVSTLGPRHPRSWSNWTASAAVVDFPAVPVTPTVRAPASRARLSTNSDEQVIQARALAAQTPEAPSRASTRRGRRRRQARNRRRDRRRARHGPPRRAAGRPSRPPAPTPRRRRSPPHHREVRPELCLGNPGRERAAQPRPTGRSLTEAAAATPTATVRQDLAGGQTRGEERGRRRMPAPAPSRIVTYQRV